MMHCFSLPWHNPSFWGPCRLLCAFCQISWLTSLLLSIGSCPFVTIFHTPRKPIWPWYCSDCSALNTKSTTVLDYLGCDSLGSCEERYVSSNRYLAHVTLLQGVLQLQKSLSANYIHAQFCKILWENRAWLKYNCNFLHARVRNS